MKMSTTNSCASEDRLRKYIVRFEMVYKVDAEDKYEAIEIAEEMREEDWSIGNGPDVNVEEVEE